VLVSCQKNIKNDTAISNYHNEFQESPEIHESYAIPDETKYKESKNQPSTEMTETAPDDEDDATLEKEILKLKPNELGQVMILMYHKIGVPEKDWVRTPENFRQDLVSLYENGYRLINLLDYIRGDIDIEAGKSPVVLTFDDATQGHFNFIETDNDVMLDPDCAIAILEEFCSHYPDFGKGATFYITYPYPFGQVEYIEEKLEFLINNGYEIGNHTYSHANLSDLSDEDIAEEIALNAKKTDEILPGYQVKSLALTYGKYPQNEEILSEGIFEGYSYNNEAILLIGSGPAPSPYSIDFELLAVPRIKASEINVDNLGMYDWIEYFKKYPGRKFISDGDKDFVAIPQELKDSLDEKSIKGKKVFFFFF
jgi:hypothetical protein